MNEMEKVLVEIQIPSINQTYDIFLPLYLPVYEVLELVERAINILSQGLYRADKNSILCDKTGEIMDINLSVFELEIHNGSKLMLI